MSIGPTRIDAPFLAEPSFRRVIDAIARNGDTARAVGGAVRNTLFGQSVTDVDIATTALPETVMKRARKAGLKPVPTGVEHGTVTVVSDHVPYEVTTLRADVETDGRRAVVAFTDNWAADAGRRDFTMNAIYADPDGTLHDPTGGIADALARRVRFIGDPEARIREDYLRILRFFRFHATYGHGAPDVDGLAACVVLQGGLDRLSRERIGQEMKKLLLAPGAAETVMLMQETGILAHVLGSPGHPGRFARMAALCVEAGVALRVGAAIAAVGADRPEDAERLAERLRLSNAQRDEIAATVAMADRLGPEPDRDLVRRAVYEAGNDLTVAGLLFATASANRPVGAEIATARDWIAPRFPITGKMLLDEGHPPGPALGRRLRELEEAWIVAGFGEPE